MLKRRQKEHNINNNNNRTDLKSYTELIKERNSNFSNYKNINRNIKKNFCSKSNAIFTTYRYKVKNKNNQIKSNLTYDIERNDRQIHPSKSVISKENKSKKLLLCQNCIKDNIYNLPKKAKEINNVPIIPEIFEDKYRNYSQDLIKEKIKKRQKYTNEIFNNFDKWDRSNEKDKLIHEIENSRNPLYEKNHNYLYEKFKKKYELKQKIINERNSNKFSLTNRPEMTNYYQNYIKKAMYNSNNKINNIQKMIKKENEAEDYRRFLDSQVSYKKRIKLKEREEDIIREKKEQIFALQSLEREKKERDIKFNKIKNELIRGNSELLKEKKKLKDKKKAEDLKYKEYYDKQNLSKDEFYDFYRDSSIDSHKVLGKIKRFKTQKKLDNNKSNTKDEFDLCSHCHKICPKKLLVEKDKKGINYNKSFN